MRAAYLQLIYIDFKNAFVYKVDTIIGIMANILSLYMYLFLWRAVLGSTAKLPEMVTYQVFGIFLGICYDGDVATLVGAKVLDGSMVMDFIKPYNYAVSMFCGSLGRMAGNFVKKGLIYLAVAFLATGFQIKMQLEMIPIFVVIMLGNMLIYWLMFFGIGLLHFVFTNAGWFARVMRDLIKLLGGSVFPLWIFPKYLSEIASVLPLWLLFQLPQSMLSGTISMSELGMPLMKLLFWIVTLVVCIFLLWRIAVKKITIQGG